MGSDRGALGRWERPALSIVVVNWNTREKLRECLESVFRHAGDLQFEVIVVDNGSSDGSEDMLRSDFHGVEIVANRLNRGFGRGANQGMSVSRGDVILLLNSDTYVRDDVIPRMVRYVISRPEVAMAGCQLRFPDGRIQHTAFRALSIWRSLFEDLWLYRLIPKARRGQILLGDFWLGDREMEVDWLAGAFMMLRREIFEKVGGFSEEFFMYGEDSEWCMRIRQAGHKILYNPLGVVYHVGNVSSDMKWSEKERLRLCHLGGLRAYSRVNGRVRGLFYHLARLFGTSVRCLVYSLVGVVKPADYYTYQRRMYGWQAGFYLRALLPRPYSTDSLPVAR